MDLDAALAAGKAAQEKRRQAALVADKLCFDKQLAFIRHAGKWKAVFTPRRSGKSNAIGIYFIEQALAHAGRKFLYLALTREQAENIVWADVLRKQLLALGLEQVHGRNPGPNQFKYGTTDRILSLGNGSTIILGGMDSGPQEMQKLLGAKYHMVAVDECQGVRQDLEHLIEEVLEPAVSDYINDGGGIIVLGGTPGLQMGNHYWWRVTKQEEDGSRSSDRMLGWEVFEWNVSDNPYMRAQFAARCERMLRERGPSYQDDPSFKRQWLGKWCLEHDDKVYKYDPKKNGLVDQKLIDSITRVEDQWTFVVGLDLGWDDATAYVVVAYKKQDRHLYVVQSDSFAQTTIHDIGTKLKKVCDLYKPLRVMVDTGSGTGKLVAESLRIDHKLPVWPAEKTEKENAIGIMNSDFQSGIIQVLPGNEKLCNEWLKLVVDARAREKGEFKEASKFLNHLADAALYAHRNSRNKLTKEPEPERERDFADELLEQKKRVESPLRKKDYFSQVREQQNARHIVAQFRGMR